jgi:hypothetical protein
MELELHGGHFLKNSKSTFVILKKFGINILGVDNVELCHIAKSQLKIPYILA